ncbi:MAG: D-tyrosyl-tRNA(Tyr) deacylase [Phycisphaeraceae bacterium]|nr:MAG: D-tyrosyl-tRNA(Tyr) deacylase [Phycisphaeraceae bacterium]
MRAVVQRVNRATLSVVEADVERPHAEIGAGLVVLVGIEQDDGEADLAWMARKLPHLRIFKDEDDKMNRSAVNLVGDGADEPGVLLVPNFTVAGRAHKGRRPDFTTAKAPREASAMFDRLAMMVAAEAPGVQVVTGVFGAHMHVDLVNEGPVTIWLDSRA